MGITICGDRSKQIPRQNRVRWDVRQQFTITRRISKNADRSARGENFDVAVTAENERHDPPTVICRHQRYRASQRFGKFARLHQLCRGKDGDP